MLAEFNSILFNSIAVRLLLNYLARFAKPKFQKMTHPTRMYYTITTYFDIVGLQVLHGTLTFNLAYHSTLYILYIVFLTLYPVRYRYNTVLYIIYCILYKVVLFLKSEKYLTLLQHGIIRITQYPN